MHLQSTTYGTVGFQDPSVPSGGGDATEGISSPATAADENSQEILLLIPVTNSRFNPFAIVSPSKSTTMLKIIALTCFSVALLQGTSAWTTPRNMLQSTAAVATISAVIAGGPTMVNAVDFTGSYSDPFHPNCKREVQVVSPKLADVTGTDGTPGCPPDGSGRKWSLIGKIDGDSLLIDFTPKGGPKDLKGVWEPSPVPGIRFPDGNLWSKKAATQ